MHFHNNCVSDLYNEILKLINNDTLIHNPIYTQLSSLLKWKQENLMAQLNKICEYIGPIEDKTDSFYSQPTASKKDEDDDKIELEAIIANNCSTSR